MKCPKCETILNATHLLVTGHCAYTYRLTCPTKGCDFEVVKKDDWVIEAMVDEYEWNKID